MKSHKVIIGIDPGITGAIAILENDETTIYDVPVLKTYRGTKKVNDYDILSMSVRLGAYRRHYDVEVCIEQVGAMPGNGSVSMFNFGRGVGIWEGICGAYGWTPVFVRPQVWKKAYGLIGLDKDASRQYALAHHSFLANYFSRKKDHGRADALLIAQWLRDR
jgi:crossover junction endodeoxyribonuclease RuvC